MLDPPATAASSSPSGGQAWGVLGGTFDPIHLGHLIVAEAACAHHRLDRMLFVLTPDPPHKQGRPLTPLATRQALIRLALADRASCFVASAIESERPGPHFTADTLPLIKARHPEVRTWFYLLGGDAALTLRSWHAPQAVLRAMRLSVLPRPGADLADLRPILTGDPAGRDISVTPLCDTATLAQIEADLIPNAPFVGISSTTIRDRVRAGQSIRYLVPDPVRHEIERAGLYAAPAPPAEPPASGHLG